MDGLRLILLGAGLAFLGGFYFWMRWQSRSSKVSAARRKEPVLNSEPAFTSDIENLNEELARMDEIVANEDSIAMDHADDVVGGTVKEQFVSISVMAPSNQTFSAQSLLKAFSNNKLCYGEQQFYQRIDRSDGSLRSVYAVANAVNPGGLPDTEKDGFTSPGITFFMQLPGPIASDLAFDDMLTTAERLAAELGGELRDQEHKPLTQQTIAHLRDGAVATSMHAH